MFEYLLSSPKRPPPGSSADGTVLLLHFDGAHGGTTFTDEVGHVFSHKGGAMTIAGEGKFGTASLYPSTMENSEIYTPDAPELRFEGDFTIECWAKIAGNGNYFLFGKNYSVLQHYQGNLYVRGDSQSYLMNVPYSGVYNTWRHIALAREGRVWRLFVDGVMIGSVETTRYSWGANPDAFRIGGVSTMASIPLNGYIDEFRAVKGKALYTANFTPPTEPFTLA